MTRSRRCLALCAMCLLMTTALAAQAATASAAGQTAFTCVSTATVKDLKTEHCVPGETGTAFGHIAIVEVTQAKLTNAKTNATTTGPTSWILKETIAGTNVEIEATGVEGLGTLENKEVGGVMQASAESDANGLIFTGVTVKAPAGKGCVVREKESGTIAVVRTKPIKGHTTVLKDKENGEGAEEERHSVIFEPASGTTFATFWIECTGTVPAALKGLWTVSGTLNCPTHGATISCNHNTVTKEEKLIAKGAEAGLQGKVAITAGKSPEGEPKDPVSVTTTTR